MNNLLYNSYVREQLMKYNYTNHTFIDLSFIVSINIYEKKLLNLRYMCVYIYLTIYEI